MSCHLFSEPSPTHHRSWSLRAEHSATATVSGYRWSVWHSAAPNSAYHWSLWSANESRFRSWREFTGECSAEYYPTNYWPFRTASAYVRRALWTESTGGSSSANHWWIVRKSTPEHFGQRRPLWGRRDDWGNGRRLVWKWWGDGYYWGIVWKSAAAATATTSGDRRAFWKSIGDDTTSSYYIWFWK